MRASEAAAGLLIAFAWLTTDPSAEAAPPKKKPAPTQITDASADSGPGKADAANAAKAVAAKQFGAAADSFDAAFAASQDFKYLYNAALARQKNNEPAKAANAYARYVKEAPPPAKERAAAQKALAKLSPKLGQLVIEAKNATALTVDSETIAPSMIGSSIYALPGSHTVEAKFAEGPTNQSATAFAGQKTSLVLVHPDPPPPTSTKIAAEDNPDARGASETGDAEKKISEHRKPLPPAVVYVGAGVTVLAGVLTVVEGLSVSSHKKDFDKNMTQANLDAGKSAQTKTNIFLAVTGVAAVFTGVTAIFFVDWKGKDKSTTVKAGIGPGNVTLGGTF